MNQDLIIVIFDTNFLILPFIEKIDIFAQIEELISFVPAVLQSTLNELDSLLAKSSLPLKRKIMLAKKMAENFIVIDDSLIEGKSFDEKILSMIEERRNQRIVVATNDRELRKKLRFLGIPVISFKSKSKRVYMEGEIY